MISRFGRKVQDGAGEYFSKGAERRAGARLDRHFGAGKRRVLPRIEIHVEQPVGIRWQGRGDDDVARHAINSGPANDAQSQILAALPSPFSFTLSILDSSLRLQPGGCQVLANFALRMLTCPLSAP